jgi:small multidrug resistance family-3 protein
MYAILKSISIFILAGLCEIGGGYLVWLTLREEKPWWVGVLGGIILVGYGVVATWQPANFGRVYAAYGGIFIIMAIIWGWKVDGLIPDKFDLIGGAIALLGMLIIMYAPRGN